MTRRRRRGGRYRIPEPYYQQTRGGGCGPGIVIATLLGIAVFIAFCVAIVGVSDSVNNANGGTAGLTPNQQGQNAATILWNTNGAKNCRALGLDKIGADCDYKLPPVR